VAGTNRLPWKARVAVTKALLYVITARTRGAASEKAMPWASSDHHPGWSCSDARMAAKYSSRTDDIDVQGDRALQEGRGRGRVEAQRPERSVVVGEAESL